MIELEKQRKAKGMSMRALMRKSGIDSAVISKAEKQITLYPAQLAKIAAALEFEGNPADLLREVAEDGKKIPHGEVAEEIERRLMPEGMEWPRFEDGTPVKFGDKFITDSGHEGTVYRIEFLKEQTNIWPREGSNIGITALTDGQRVRRSLVLAADGKTIEVGQTLYGEDGHAFEVVALHHGDDYDVEVDGEWHVNASGEEEPKRVKAKWLTHEKPCTENPANGCGDTWKAWEDDLRQIIVAAKKTGLMTEPPVATIIGRAKALADFGADTGIDRSGEVE